MSLVENGADHLQGKTTVVTGAAGGLGLALVHALVSCGATVVAADLDTGPLDQLAHDPRTRGSVVAVRADISDIRGHNAIGAAVESTGTHLALWVNNAGIVIREPAEVISVDQWDRLFSVNVQSVLLGSQTAYRLMKPHQSGSIVNLSSVTAARVMELRSGYGTSKAAIESLTRYLAAEWGARGVRVNAVAPGFVLTPLSHLASADETEVERTIEEVPLHRLGTPEDIAGVIIALATPLFSYVTGQTLRVDGGWTL